MPNPQGGVHEKTEGLSDATFVMGEIPARWEETLNISAETVTHKTGVRTDVPIVCDDCSASSGGSVQKLVASPAQLRQGTIQDEDPVDLLPDVWFFVAASGPVDGGPHAIGGLKCHGIGMLEHLVAQPTGDEVYAFNAKA